MRQSNLSSSVCDGRVVLQAPSAKGRLQLCWHTVQMENKHLPQSGEKTKDEADKYYLAWLSLRGSIQMLQDPNHWHCLVSSLCGYGPWREMISTHSPRRPMQMLGMIWFQLSRICLAVATPFTSQSDSILFYFSWFGCIYCLQSFPSCRWMPQTRGGGKKKS